ncbi:MAG: LytTR family DNA-binding domain-containing protein [Lachnospiraceae bacterium]
MKVIVHVDSSLTDDELHIHCKELTPNIIALQKNLQSTLHKRKELTVYKHDIEYFIPLSNVLFFETQGRDIMLHTDSDAFAVKYKLYELEEMLPNTFVRISKSAIVNIAHIYAIDRNMISSGMISFYDTHKEVGISRMYYKQLKATIETHRH